MMPATVPGARRASVTLLHSTTEYTERGLAATSDAVRTARCVSRCLYPAPLVHQHNNSTMKATDWLRVDRPTTPYVDAVGTRSRVGYQVAAGNGSRGTQA